MLFIFILSSFRFIEINPRILLRENLIIHLPLRSDHGRFPSNPCSISDCLLSSFQILICHLLEHYLGLEGLEKNIILVRTTSFMPEHIGDSFVKKLHYFYCYRSILTKTGIIFTKSRQLISEFSSCG